MLSAAVSSDKDQEEEKRGPENPYCRQTKQKESLISTDQKYVGNKLQNVSSGITSLITQPSYPFIKMPIRGNVRRNMLKGKHWSTLPGTLHRKGSKIPHVKEVSNSLPLFSDLKAACTFYLQTIGSQRKKATWKHLKNNWAKVCTPCLGFLENGAGSALPCPSSRSVSQPLHTASFKLLMANILSCSSSVLALLTPFLH